MAQCFLLEFSFNGLVMKLSFDENLNKIAEKIEKSERLTFDDGVALFRTQDLNALGKLADYVRRRMHVGYIL